MSILNKLKAKQSQLASQEFVTIKFLGTKSETGKAIQVILSNGETQWIPMSCISFKDTKQNEIKVSGWFVAKEMMTEGLKTFNPNY